MLREVHFRPKAEEDLNDIWDYTVLNWSQEQATSYLEGLEAAVNLLREFPESVRLREEFTPSIRAYSYRSHLVIFTSDDTRIEVIRVLHARSNWQVLFSE